MVIAIHMDWLPDLRQLRAFVAVAEEGSFTLAARRLSLTQSAVSHSMRALEQQLGCRLLDRTGRQVVATAEGEMLLERCRGVLNEIRQVAVDLEGLRRWGQSRIRVGAPHSLCHTLVPSIVREFREAFPHCAVTIDVGDTAALLEKLGDRELDLVVGMRLRGRASVGYRPMYRDALAMLVSPFHPWASEPSLVETTFHDQQFIIYARASETHRMIEDWLKGRLGGLGRTLVLGDLQAILEMAKSGIGVALVAPWVATREIDAGSLRVIQADGLGIEREWGVFHAPRRQPTPVEEVWIGLCELAFGLMPSV